jgi:hypothetical protein
MKTVAFITAFACLAAGQAFANPEFDNHANYGAILQDLDKPVAASGDYAPTGDLVAVIASNDDYGSVLFDLDQASAAGLSAPPSIGDSADDYGNILYDTGSVY